MTESYRKLHTERQNLLTNWENSLEALALRDKEIASNQATFDELRQSSIEQAEQLMQVRDEYERRKQDNARMEKSIKDYERLASKVKNDVHAMRNSLERIDDNVATAKVLLQKSTNLKYKLFLISNSFRYLGPGERSSQGGGT